MEDFKSIFDFHLDPRSRETLKSIALWTAIVAVCGFIMLGFAIFSSIKGVVAMQRFGRMQDIVVYAVALVVYGIIAFFLNYFLRNCDAVYRKNLYRNFYVAYHLIRLYV